jgi:hypothetical protein
MQVSGPGSRSAVGEGPSRGPYSAAGWGYRRYDCSRRPARGLAGSRGGRGTTDAGGKTGELVAIGGCCPEDAHLLVVFLFREA